MGKNKQELNNFYNQFIFPIIKKKTNFLKIQANFVKIAENPNIVKSRSYQQVWEECCRLFEKVVELALSDIFHKKSKHKCPGKETCQKCQDKLYYKNKCGLLNTIEDELIKRYSIHYCQRAFENNNTSSSEDEKHDLFECGINKEFIQQNINDMSAPFPFEENESMVVDYSSENVEMSEPTEANSDIVNYNIISNVNSMVKSSSIQSKLNENDTSHSSTIGTCDSSKQILSKKQRLKKFQFKFAKRENIDKKVLRKFKKYLKDKYKKKQSDIVTIFNKNKFWVDFITLNLMPPFTYPNEGREYKSFNTTYMSWVFDHQYSLELYTIFIQNNYDNLLHHFIQIYNLNENDDELGLLKTYLSSMAVLFSSSSQKDSNVSGISNYIFEVIPQKEETNKNINTNSTKSSDILKSFKEEKNIIKKQNTEIEDDLMRYYEEDDDYRFYSSFNNFY